MHKAPITIIFIIISTYNGYANTFAKARITALISPINAKELHYTNRTITVIITYYSPLYIEKALCPCPYPY